MLGTSGINVQEPAARRGALSACFLHGLHPLWEEAIEVFRDAGV
jgi:hypothetical protein